MTTVRTRIVNPNDLVIPEIRVTNYMDGETREQFDVSLAGRGIMEPPLVMDDGEQLIVVDGRNRVEAAINAGMTKIQVLVRKGSLQEAVLDNLATATLHGKPDPREILNVVVLLTEEEGLSSDDIAEKTGMTRNYIEDLILLHRGDPDVLLAWQKSVIGKAHAQIFNNIEDEHMRAVLLAQCIEYNWTAKVLAEMRDEALNIQQEPAPDPTPPEPSAPARVVCFVTGIEGDSTSMVYRPISREGIEMIVTLQRELEKAAAADGGP